MISRTKRLHGLVIATVFFVVGIVSFIVGDAQLADAEQIGLISLVIAAAVVIYVLRTTSSPKVGMVLDDNGLWFRDWDLPPVPWRYVADAYPIGARLRPMICIEMEDADTYFDGLDQATRQRAQRNPLVRPPQLKIRNSILDVPLSDVVAAVKEGRNRAPGQVDGS